MQDITKEIKICTCKNIHCGNLLLNIGKMEKPIFINFCPKYDGETPLFLGSIHHKREVGPKGDL